MFPREIFHLALSSENDDRKIECVFTTTRRDATASSARGGGSRAMWRNCFIYYASIGPSFIARWTRERRWRKTITRDCDRLRSRDVMRYSSLLCSDPVRSNRVSRFSFTFEITILCRRTRNSLGITGTSYARQCCRELPELIKTEFTRMLEKKRRTQKLRALVRAKRR